MPEESESASPSQALQFITLFRREGRSLIGLLLLEIGWVALLLLAAKLSGEKREPAVEIWSARVTFLSLWAYGALVIFSAWLLYSGILGNLVAAAYGLLKLLLGALFTVLLIPFFLLDVALLQITAARQRPWLKEWMQNHKHEWIRSQIDQAKKDRRDLNEQDAATAYENWLNELKQKQGDDALERMALEKSPFKPISVQGLWQALGNKFLAPLESSIRIGIAAPIIYSRTEGSRVGIAPFPSLLSAIEAVRSRKKHLQVLKDLHVFVLPSLFKVSTQARARFWRFFLGLDCLLWTTIAVSKQHTANVFIQPRPRASPEQEEDPYGNARQRRFFPENYEDLDLDVFGLAVPAEDYHAFYAALMVAIILTLCRRGKGKRLDWLTSWDRSLRHRDRLASELMDHLAFEVLPFLSGNGADQQCIPSAASQVAEIVGRWIGVQLRGKFSTLDRWTAIGEHLFGEQLLGVTGTCCKLAPHYPDHAYRMGAIACFLGNQQLALTIFRRAAKLAACSPFLRRTGASVTASMVLSFDAKSGIGLAEQLGFARYAAHAACAIALGTSLDTEKIREELQNPRAVFARVQNRTAAIPVVEQLLSEAEA